MAGTNSEDRELTQEHKTREFLKVFLAKSVPRVEIERSRLFLVTREKLLVINLRATHVHTYVRALRD